MRIRAVAVVVENGHLLVMRRRRGGREYVVLPGGGIESGESPQAACLRELVEETGLQGELGALLPVPLESGAPALYFVVRTEFAPPVLGGPEADRSDAADVYEPCWIPLDRVDDLALVPEGARVAVQHVGSPPPGGAH